MGVFTQGLSALGYQPTKVPIMKLWKAFSKSLTNLLAVLDNFTDGTNELSLMYKDACHSARQEQALEALSDLNQLAKSTGASEEVVTKLQASM
jgi:hypothetical protein